MTIDVTQVLCGLDGNPLTEVDQKTREDVDITLRAVMCSAVMRTAPDASGEDKAKAWNLAMRIQSLDEVTLTAEEVAAIKTKIGEDFNPQVVGPAWLALDPDSMAAQEAE